MNSALGIPKVSPVPGLQYVCGQNHPQLDSNVSHAWFELGNFIIDITYDQFAGTGPSGLQQKTGLPSHDPRKMQG
jgi:hypothetical protein